MQVICEDTGRAGGKQLVLTNRIVHREDVDPQTRCPDTVHDVIFDTRYGIQFSPVETGGIYAEPNEQSVIAAKLCLEGYNVAGDSLYFVNPETGSTAWFRETKTFVVTLGDHDFYA